MHITPLYAALLARLFVGLCIRTVRLRNRLSVAVGDAGNATLQRAIRVHSNFAEYIPLALLLIYFVELSDAKPEFVHVLGAAILSGRLSHAYGVSQVKEDYRFRIFGMVMTFTPMVAAALWLLYSFATRGSA